MVKLEKKVLNSSKKDSSAKANEADTFCLPVFLFYLYL